MKHILAIDTSRTSQVIVSLTSGDQELKKQTETKFGSQVLLNMIEELLTEAKITPADLTEIKVQTGPGSYTGLKVGAAVANALAYSLKIPVNGKDQELDLQYD